MTEEADLKRIGAHDHAAPAPVPPRARRNPFAVFGAFIGLGLILGVLGAFLGLAVRIYHLAAGQ